MGAITEATDKELEDYRRAIVAEQERRRTIASANDRLDELTRDVLAARGVKEGDEWIQPTSAADAYPLGWITAHNGKMWTSLVGGNVWEPGTSAWRELASDPDVAPEWIQPTGGHDAYNTGDRVTFEGAEYVSKIDGNTWSPTAYPAGWELVS